MTSGLSKSDKDGLHNSSIVITNNEDIMKIIHDLNRHTISKFPTDDPKRLRNTCRLTFEQKPKTRRSKTPDLCTGTIPDSCTRVVDLVVDVPSQFGSYRGRRYRVETEDRSDPPQSRKSVVEVLRQETGLEYGPYITFQVYPG